VRPAEIGLCSAKRKGGAARIFVNPERNPALVSLREPHPGYPLGRSALRQCLQKVGLDPDEFLRLLEDC
jgi:hypothetical protein